MCSQIVYGTKTIKTHLRTENRFTALVFVAVYYYHDL